jgi:hypothetical protein
MKPVLTIDEAMLLVAMPGTLPGCGFPRRTTDHALFYVFNAPRPVIRAKLIRLRRLGLVSKGQERLVYPHGLKVPTQTSDWRLTAKGERRKLLLELLPSQVAAMNARGKSGGDRFLAEADVKAGPSRAMYPASVLQGRGG